MIKGPLKFLGIVALGLGAAFAVPAVATASPTPGPDCRTVTVHLDARPDSGNHGPWATDTTDRTAKICHVPGPAPSATIDTISGQHQYDNWHYQATVIDSGTFVTTAGTANSPGKGHALAVVHGFMGGSYTATFTAPEKWSGWLGQDWNGKTLTGAAGTTKNPSTSDWVKALWSKGFDGNSINDDWKWTYWTCAKSPVDSAEQWIDDWTHNGTGPNDGDITGKACPSPSPSPTKGGVVPTPTGSPEPGALPVTGTRTDLMLAAGVLLLGGGAGAFYVGRRKRNRIRFTA